MTTNKFEQLKLTKELFNIIINEGEKSDKYKNFLANNNISSETAKKRLNKYIKYYASEEEKNNWIIYINFKNLKLSLDEIEYIYESLKNSNWNSKKSIELQKQFNISASSIRKYILKYEDIILKLPTQKQKVLTNEESKQDFQINIAKELFNLFIEKHEISREYQQFLEKNNLSKTKARKLIDDYLTYHSTDKDKEDWKIYNSIKRLKLTIDEIKYIYETLKNSNWNFNKSNELQKQFNISYSALLNYIHTYENMILKIPKENQFKGFNNPKTKIEQTKEQKQLKKFCDLLKEIKNIKNDDEKIKICKKYSYILTKKDIEENIKIYCTIYSKKKNLNYDLLLKKVTNIFSCYLYSEIIKKESQKNLLFNKYSELLNNFIDSNLSAKEFEENNNLRRKTIQTALAYMKTKDIKEYNRIQTKIKENEKIKIEALVNKHEKDIKLLLFYLNNGIEENNVIRDFDCIDFYETFNIDSKYFLTIVDEIFKKNMIGKDEYYKIRYFASPFINVKKNMFSINRLHSIQNLNNNDIKELIKDQKFHNLNGTLIEITKEEKENIVDYLKENNICVNVMTYNAGINRIKQGFSIKPNNKKFTK